MEQPDGVRAMQGDEGTGAARRAGRRGGPLLWMSMALAAGLVALLVVAVLRPAEDSPLTALNRPAPDFTLSLYGGGKLRLADLRSKTVVVNFWWSGCEPCKEEAPILERQWRAWKDKGVVFVGVNEQDDPSSEAPRAFLKAHGVTYSTGPDPGYVDIQYGVTGQPETFFITPRGTITKRYAMPFSDDRTLARFIAEARA